MTPQEPNEARGDEDRGARTKWRRVAILILVALILGYPTYKEDVFATVGVDVKQAYPHGAVVGIREEDGIQTGNED